MNLIKAAETTQFNGIALCRQLTAEVCEAGLEALLSFLCLMPFFELNCLPQIVAFQDKIIKELWFSIRELLRGYQWGAKSNQNDTHPSSKALRILLNEIENLPLYINSASNLIFQVLQPSTKF